jgi:tetratricopeptide (TPR) repeat protein
MSATIASWCARLLGASLALCVLTGPFHPSTAAAQDEAVTDSLDSAARALFEDGRHAFETGDFATALARFQQAYDISHRVPLLWNIAATLDRLRRDEEALDMFEQYLAAVPEAANRDEVLGRVRVLREAVEARRAEVAAREAEAARLEEERQRLEEERRARESGGSGGGADEPASGGITPVVFIVAAGLTAVAGGVLIWSGIDTLTANDNYVAAADANRPLADIESLYGSAMDAQTRTNVMIGVTSALAITSVILIFFTDWGGGSGESATPTVSLLPTLDMTPAGDLGGAGLSLRGTF